MRTDQLVGSSDKLHALIDYSARQSACDSFEVQSAQQQPGKRKYNLCTAWSAVRVAICSQIETDNDDISGLDVDEVALMVCVKFGLPR